MPLRTVTYAQRRRIRKEIPTRKCSARKQDGGPCRKDAVIGAAVCDMHGGRAPQVKEHAARRVALADAIASQKPRPAGQVILDVAHETDVVWRQLRTSILLRDLGSVSVEDLQRLIDLGDRAGKWAKTVMDIGLEERWVRVAEEQASQMFAMVARVLDGLGLTESQRERANILLRAEAEALASPKVIEGKARKT